MLVVRCGLLAKWLRVSLGLGLGLGPGNALAVLFVCFFPSGIISVVNIFVFGGSVSAQRITYEYSINDVTATWIEVESLPISIEPEYSLASLGITHARA